MKNIITILLICLLTSCMDREVQLPHTTNNDITEVLDVSPIYIFYDETKSDSVDFNRNNMISTTNWLVNIDKRLTLKQVLPHLQYLQEKRHGDGMHTNENAKNYFTCFNPETENLSFIEFTDITYRLARVNRFATEIPNYKFKTTYERDSIIKVRKSLTQSIGLTLRMELDFVTANSFISFAERIKNDSLNAYLNETINLYPNNKTIEIGLGFNHNLSLENYISIKTRLQQFESEHLIISNEEFIYN